MDLRCLGDSTAGGGVGDWCSTIYVVSTLSGALEVFIVMTNLGLPKIYGLTRDSGSQGICDCIDKSI